MIDSVRFFSAKQVHSILQYAALADAIADALKDGVVAPLRHAHAMSATDSLLLMPAWNEGAIGVKLVSVQPLNRRYGRATVNALYALFDRETGEPRAVIDGEALTLRRTAAASLLAARYLAREDACRLLLVGTGRLARYLAHAHSAGRHLDRIMVWGRNREHAQSLASALTNDGLPAGPVTDLEAAVAAADIISCATTSDTPVVRGSWLRPGTHLDLVGAFKRGMREVDDTAVSRSRVYVDTRVGALAEADDVIEPIEHGMITREHVIGELSELVTGAVAGRGGAEQITLFKSVGTAIEDLAAAQLLLKSTR